TQGARTNGGRYGRLEHAGGSVGSTRAAPAVGGESAPPIAAPLPPAAVPTPLAAPGCASPCAVSPPQLKPARDATTIESPNARQRAMRQRTTLRKGRPPPNTAQPYPPQLAPAAMKSDSARRPRKGGLGSTVYPSSSNCT